MTATTRKQPRTFGKVEQLKSGNYRAGYPDPQSKARPKPYIWAPHTFAKKAPADAWLAKVKADIDGLTWLHPDEVAEREAATAAEAERKRITLGEYADRWLGTRRNSRGEPLKPRTVAERRRLLRAAGTKSPTDPGGPLAELVPLVLGDITAERVRAWYAEQQERGTITQTSRAYELLKAIMTTALEEDELIDRQPCRIKGGSTASSKKEHAAPANEEQFEALLDALPGRYRTLAVIAGAAGCRWGEITDLRADDVTVILGASGSAEKVFVRVDSAVVHVEGEYIEGETKTGSAREVRLVGQDAVEIAVYVEGLSGRQRLFTAVKSDDPLASSTFWRHFNKARIAAGLPKTTPHDLRAYAATRYARAQATTREVMEFLDHKTSDAAMRYQRGADEARLDQLAEATARGAVGTASTPSN